MHVRCVMLFAASLAATTTALADDLRLSGAPGLLERMTPRKESIEAEAGVRLALKPETAGEGLFDLLQGRADAALIDSATEAVARGLSLAKPGSIKGALEVVQLPVGQVPVAFYVHASNPVKTLSRDDVARIYSGKVSNWKDLGGADQPIKAFALSPLNGSRMAVNDTLLAKESMAARVTTRGTSKDVLTLLSAAPNGIAFLAEQVGDASVHPVAVEPPVTTPLYLVIRGEPSPAQKRIADGLRQTFSTPSVASK
jgi:phosphate transport system substrate-binding protein